MDPKEIPDLAKHTVEVVWHRMQAQQHGDAVEAVREALAQAYFAGVRRYAFIPSGGGPESVGQWSGIDKPQATLLEAQRKIEQAAGVRF